ncbi:PREDICTED: F-box/kelch-repeat protein At5g03020-like [Camelina sativa]|uniref:F-box/kelch-repeat protein At5g03020-like n=1 Tax=Camelina sativa TaxID=90675 RepID=A0ABM0XTC8_CAMSA|nr:PREDICTED: F-box/kelch-repeat protein At5g03020-like [Camelina sativa]
MRRLLRLRSDDGRDGNHSPTSFSSLPDDVALNCLARISRFHYPTLSLVSKGFRSLLASPDLEATRSFIGNPENHLCVCLKLNNNPNLCWFTVSPIPKQRLKPIPSYPQQQRYPQSPTVVSTGSEIYVIGGFVNGKRSRRVFVFDCRSHQWRRIRNMHLPRAAAAADVNEDNGKIHVMGGCRFKECEEVYDPKTNTWESPKPLDFAIRKNMFMFIEGKVYGLNGLKFNLKPNVCLLEIESVFYLISVSDGNLLWREPKQGFVSVEVNGIEELSSHHFVAVAVSRGGGGAGGGAGGGGRVTVWWKSVTEFLELEAEEDSSEECETNISCAEILFERRGLNELWGFVQWSKEVFTVGGFDPTSNFFLNSAVVTY